MQATRKEFFMKIQHSPHHWLWVALVLGALLLTVSLAHGQSTGAAAAFEGRPAMAGAQGGLGAQAGPPQGGIGLQGNEGAQRSVAPRGQGFPLDMPQGTPAGNAPNASSGANVAVVAREGATPARDQGVAKEQRATVKKTKRAAKRTVTRSRHGTSEIDSQAGASVR
jgi:hypothetical protein